MVETYYNVLLAFLIDGLLLFFFWLMKVFLGINIDVSKFTKSGKKGTKMVAVEEK